MGGDPQSSVNGQLGDLLDSPLLHVVKVKAGSLRAAKALEGAMHSAEFLSLDEIDLGRGGVRR